MCVISELFHVTECDMEYLPPTNFLLNVLEPPKPELLSPEGSKALQQEEDFLVILCPVFVTSSVLKEKTSYFDR